jgi:intein/homing endonuclease
MIKLEIGTRISKFSGDDIPTLKALYKHLSFRHPESFYIKQKMRGEWDGLVHPMSKSGNLATGLIPKALEFLNVEDLLVVDNRPLPPIGEVPLTVGEFALREYQVEAIKAIIYGDLYGLRWPRGFIFAGMGAGKCCCEGTKVSIKNQGLINIEDVEIGSLVYTEKGFKKVLNKVYTGKINSIKLTTHRGYSLTSGYDNHRLKVFEDEWFWKYSRDFKVGDLIPISYGAFVEGVEKKVSRILINPEVGYLLGCIHGDGTLRTHLSITAHPQDIELLKRLEQTILDLFKKEKGEESLMGLIYPKLDGNFKLSVGRKSLMNWLGNFPELSGGAFKKRVPKLIFESSLEVQKAYIRGYFDTDGSVDSSRKKVSLSSVSLEGIQDLKSLLLNFGIISTFDIKKTSWQGGNKSTSNRIHISGYSLVKFIEQIGFGLSRKQKRLLEINPVQTNRRGGFYIRGDWDYFPEEHEYLLVNLLKEASKVGLPLQKYDWARLLRNDYKFTRFTVSEQLKDWVTLKDSTLYQQVEELNQYFWDRISLVEGTISNTWDISVEETQSYISNGFISHNTLIMMGTYLGFNKSRTMILLDNSKLYIQIKRDLHSLFPHEYGYMQGKEVKWGNIMVGMIKTVKNRLSEFRKEFNTFRVLLVDEADLAGNATYNAVFKEFPNAGARIGFSGTVFLRDLKKDALRNNTLREYFGDILFSITAKELEDQEFTTKAIVKLVPGLKGGGEDFIDEFNNVIGLNPAHHYLILKRVRYNLMTHKYPIMVFTRYIEQTEVLGLYLKSALPNVSLDWVHHKRAEQKVLDNFKDGKIKVLVCSLFLKRGLSFPLVRCIINASAGEFYSNPLQVLGRGTRTNEGKKKVFYFEDIMDSGTYLTRHSKARVLQYKREKYFIRNLI